MKYNSSFRLIDIEPRDFRVYEKMLELGESSIRNIAEAGHLNRGTTYEIIKKLIDCGLVRGINHHSTRVKYYAEPPSKIVDLIKERQSKLANLEKEAEVFMPELSALAKSGESAFVGFYEGFDGVSALLNDVLRTMQNSREDEYYVYSSNILRTYLYVNFPNYTKHRIEYGLFVKVIAVGPGGEQAKLSERRWVKDPSHHPSSYMIIYDNKVAVISLSTSQVPYAVLIEDEGVTEMQKMVFNKLWSSLKPSA